MLQPLGIADVSCWQTVGSAAAFTGQGTSLTWAQVRSALMEPKLVVAALTAADGITATGLAFCIESLQLCRPTQAFILIPRDLLDSI